MTKAAELQTRGIRNEFEQQQKQTDAQFEEQRRQTDARFDAVYAQFDAMQAKQSITDTKQNNQTAFRLRSKIYYVEHFDPTSQTLRQPPPDIFLRWVGTFWRFKEPQNRDKLVRLHEFYQTEDWERWGLDSFKPEDEDTGEQLVPGHKSMTEAVEYASDLALSELAQHLGLNYYEISIHVTEDVATKQSRQTGSQQSKRSVHIANSLSPRGKHLKALRKSTQALHTHTHPIMDLKRESSTGSSNQTPPSPTEVSSASHLPLQNLIDDVDSHAVRGPRSTVSNTQLGWKPPSEKPPSDKPPSDKPPSDP